MAHGSWLTARQVLAVGLEPTSHRFLRPGRLPIAPRQQVNKECRRPRGGRAAQGAGEPAPIRTGDLCRVRATLSPTELQIHVAEISGGSGDDRPSENRTRDIRLIRSALSPLSYGSRDANGCAPGAAPAASTEWAAGAVDPAGLEPAISWV